MTRAALSLSAVVAFFAFALHPRVARADVPSDYKGTPYKGTPTAIPGRVELTNVDLGGSGVAWHADHNRTNSAGYQPISGNDYRSDDQNLPNICKTNVNPPPDTWVQSGDPYPSATDKSWYYIGYAHAVDWVKLTVDVRVSGTYTVSSSFASAGAEWGCSIWFNDGHSPVDAARPHDGVNKSGTVVMNGTSDYHKWKAYPNFATFHLDAGLQVMTFHLEKFDHLQYGFLQFDLAGSDGGATDSGDAADAGASPVPPDAATSTGAAGAPTGAGGNAAGATGATGTAGNGAPLPPSTGGASASAAGGGTAGAGGHHASSGSGCAIGSGEDATTMSPLLLGAFLAFERLRRRRSQCKPRTRVHTAQAQGCRPAPADGAAWPWARRIVRAAAPVPTCSATRIASTPASRRPRKEVRVTETSSAPEVVALIRRHADVVSAFLKHGMPKILFGRCLGVPLLVSSSFVLGAPVGSAGSEPVNTTGAEPRTTPRHRGNDE
jgi:hypothetical protein